VCSRSDPLWFWLPPDVPRQQLVDAVDRVLGNALEHLAQVGLGIQAVELRGLHQAVQAGRATAASSEPKNKSAAGTAP
jgi:hypothetical protein